jgi:sugar phosphate isomerase/epimerase
MLSRRSFNQTAFWGLMASAAPVPALATGEAKKPGFGIILNTVKSALAEDRWGTLATLAEMGYRYVETKPFDDDPRGTRRRLRRLGLKVPVTGAGMQELMNRPDRVADRAREIGARYVTCYWPWLTDARNLTQKECEETAGRLNKIGRFLSQRKLGFTWHNHDKEFARVGEQSAFDLLMRRTDPEWVSVQLDTYWAAKGGATPEDLMHQYAGRIALLHLKDMNAQKGMACVGGGELNMPAILAARATAGVRFSVVEHDRPADGLKCAQESILALR